MLEVGCIFSMIEKKQLWEVPFPSQILTDWLRGQTTLLLSTLEPLDSTTLQFSLSLAIYKQLTFLTRAEFTQTRFVAQQMCGADMYATQTHPYILFVKIFWNGALSHSIYLGFKYSLFSLKQIWLPSAMTQVTGMMMSNNTEHWWEIKLKLTRQGTWCK